MMPCHRVLAQPGGQIVVLFFAYRDVHIWRQQNMEHGEVVECSSIKSVVTFNPWAFEGSLTWIPQR